MQGRNLETLEPDRSDWWAFRLPQSPQRAQNRVLLPSAMEDSQSLDGRDGPSYPLHRVWGSTDTDQSRLTKAGFGCSTGSACRDKSLQCVRADAMRPNGGHNPTFLRGPGMKLSPVSPLSRQQWVGQTGWPLSSLVILLQVTPRSLEPVPFCQSHRIPTLSSAPPTAAHL